MTASHDGLDFSEFHSALDDGLSHPRPSTSGGGSSPFAVPPDLQLTSPSTWSTGGWDFLSLGSQQQPTQAQQPTYAHSAAHTPSYAGSVSDYNASESDFFAEPESERPFGGLPPSSSSAAPGLPSFVESGSYMFEPAATDLYGSLAPLQQFGDGQETLPRRSETLTQAAQIEELMTGEPVQQTRPWSRSSTMEAPRPTSAPLNSLGSDIPRSNSPDSLAQPSQPTTQMFTARRQESFDRTTFNLVSPPPDPRHGQMPPPQLVRQTSGKATVGSPLSRLEIPLPPDVAITEATPMDIEGERTAGPGQETARPGQPRSRGTNEVDKLLRELEADQQKGSQTGAWNGFLTTAGRTAPTRQRSLSDVSGASPTMLSFSYGLPPNYGQPPQQQPLALGGDDFFDASRPNAGDIAVPSGSGYPTPIYSSDSYDEDDSRESQVGPRRRSDVHTQERPSWAPYHGGASSLGVPGGGSSLQRTHSSTSTGHHRNAYSEDFSVTHGSYDATGPGLGSAPFTNYGMNGDYSIPTFPMQQQQQQLYGPSMAWPPVQPPHRSNSAQSWHSGASSSQHSRSSSYAGPDGADIIPDPVHRISQTTEATKAAAAARRKPGSEAKFVCDYCGETFTRAYNLKGHLRAHNGERPFVCDQPGCDKSFARAHDLKRHSALHTGLANYVCGGCGRAFKRLDALETGKQCLLQMAAQKASGSNQADSAGGSSDPSSSGAVYL